MAKVSIGQGGALACLSLWLWGITATEITGATKGSNHLGGEPDQSLRDVLLAQKTGPARS
jgi:hypothetical protein